MGFEANCVDGKCLIPGGAFTMGSPAGVGDFDEHPQREVTMTAFKIGQTEVSLGDYRRYLAEKKDVQLKALFSGRAGCFSEMNGKSDALPATCLTMQERRDYCRAQGGDLPTAAQLHFASRYDQQDSVVLGKDKRLIWSNGFRTIQPVTSGYQNRFGVYNLLGNVWESTLDAYDRKFYTRMASTNPYNPLINPWTLENMDGQMEEVSGGSFYAGLMYARVGERSLIYFDGFDGDVGFRCAWPQDSK